MYLHLDSQGCALFRQDSPEPFFRIQEPLLLAEGIMTDDKTAHLVILKTNGELCYTLISGFSNPQTTLIAKLDTRNTIYRRFFIFPQGNMVHIFYAHSHQAIRDLWHIEHRFWNGSSWNSVHMGEAVHPREPLYHVNQDQLGNLHFLAATFQGRHSLLFVNRFNGTFHIWGSLTEALKISGEVIDMSALMSSNNVQHLFWVIRLPNDRFEVHWAQQTNVTDLSSVWLPSSGPIKAFASPWKNLGTIEINGILWLLARASETALLFNDGTAWKSVPVSYLSNSPCQWVYKSKRAFQQTFWLEDQAVPRTPAYGKEMGICLNQPGGSMIYQTPPVSTAPFVAAVPPVSTSTPAASAPPASVVPPVASVPPVPAFYPGEISSGANSSPIQTQVNLTSGKAKGAENNMDAAGFTNAVNAEQIVDTVNTLTAITGNATESRKIENDTNRFPSGEESADETTEPQPIFKAADDQSEGATAEGLEEVPTTEASELLTKELTTEAAKNPDLERLITVVSNLEQENSSLNLVLQNLLSKFEQILDTLAGNLLHTQQIENSLAGLHESQLSSQNSNEVLLKELEPFKEAMSHLEEQTQTISQALQDMLMKHEESDSSLEVLGQQINQLQEDKKNERSKGGFWNKWIT